ncbi:hypothetical protein [Methylopila sp. M107]|uniref:hypothetical protein n=1 Tax=Methylopila sp. M107 TaxID=1101190 RepID=UPI00039D673D|nr:hypothetical protein [Methylopila sp. M107]
MDWRGIGAALLAVELAVGLAGPAEAGAFTLEHGRTKLFLTGVLNSGDHYFDADGRLKRRGIYRKYDLQLYGEHGLREGLTVFGSAGLQRIKTKDGASFERAGLGRTEFGLRAKMFERVGWIGSVQGSAVIAGAKKGPDLAVVGETDDQFDGRVLVARSFEAFGKPAFVDLAAGYRVRTGDPADEARFDATFGVRPSPRLLVMAQSFNTIGVARWRGPYALRQRIYKLQGAAIYDLTDNWSLIGAAFCTPAGRDALDERGATFGVGLKF